jgi:hypothetical protein
MSMVVLPQPNPVCKHHSRIVRCHVLLQREPEVHSAAHIPFRFAGTTTIAQDERLSRPRNQHISWVSHSLQDLL